MNTTSVIAPPALVRRAGQVDTKAVQALDSAHFFHPFTDHADLATRGSRIMTHAENIYVWDSEGKKVLDAMSGLWCVNAGYARKELADAAYQQMMTLPYYNAFFQTTNVPAVQLATKLASLAPTVGDRSFEHVFYSSSGSESNDTNVRMVRRYWDLLGQPQRKVIIGRTNGYHGSTMAAASLGGMSGMHAQGDLPIPDITHIGQPYFFEDGLAGETEEQFGLRAGLRLLVGRLTGADFHRFRGERIHQPMGNAHHVGGEIAHAEGLGVRLPVPLLIGNTGKHFARVGHLELELGQ